MRIRFFASALAGVMVIHGAEAQTQTYMLLHNLGCRQTNHTYNGYIYFNEFDEGDLVEVVLAGANSAIDSPLADGSPGGDDVQARNPGLPFAMNPESFTHYHDTFYSPNAILIQDSGAIVEPALRAGTSFYVRAWNGPTYAQSTRYFNSATLTRDFPQGIETCPYPAAVRTLPLQLQVPNLISYAVTFDSGHEFSPPSSVFVVRPNERETLFADSILNITWEQTPSNVPIDVLLSRNNGVSWETLFADTSTAGDIVWTVTGPSCDSCLLRVQFAQDTAIFDVSDDSFSIVAIVHVARPEVTIFINDGSAILQWESIAGANQYLLEQSYTQIEWTTLSVQPDTVFTVALDARSDTVSHFRVTCVP